MSKEAMKRCHCGSYAFNLYKEDIDQGNLCDVHYWQDRAQKAEAKQEQHTLSSRVNDVRVHIEHGKQHDEAMKRITAKQEQGEPVGEMQLSAIYEGMVVPVVPVELPAGTKLYTTPQQRKPLTDEMIAPMFKKRKDQETIGEKDAWYFYAWGVNDGEAAHGIKE